MIRKDNSKLNELIAEYGIKDVNDVHEFVKMLTAETIDGEFEPQLVKKHQTDISSIEVKVIFLYSQSVSTREIQKAMQEMYDINVDVSRVSRITDKILPLIKERKHYNII